MSHCVNCGIVQSRIGILSTVSTAVGPPGVEWAPGVGRGALGPEVVFMGVLLVGCGPDAGLVARSNGIGSAWIRSCRSVVIL